MRAELRFCYISSNNQALSGLFRFIVMVKCTLNSKIDLIKIMKSVILYDSYSENADHMFIENNCTEIEQGAHSSSNIQNVPKLRDNVSTSISTLNKVKRSGLTL